MIETDASKYLKLIPSRLSDSNKGTYGKILILAGTDGMSGAAYLSALAAYRTGSGLVKFLTHSSNRIILQTLLPEAIYEGYDASTDLKTLLERNVSWADIIVLGPGIGTSDLSKKIVSEAFSAIQEIWPDTTERKQPLLIVDADGLNILSSNDALKEKLYEIARDLPVVITPHPMEMSRLSGQKIEDILSAPDIVAGKCSRRYNLITLLKGSHTIVSAPSGALMFQNTSESPALSKGGSGDVLSGAIAGVYSIMRAAHMAGVFTCDIPDYFSGSSVPDFEDGKKHSSEKIINHHYVPYISTIIGMLIHSEAGREMALSKGVHGVLPRETADCLGRVLEHYIAS